MNENNNNRRSWFWPLFFIIGFSFVMMSVFVFLIIAAISGVFGMDHLEMTNKPIAIIKVEGPIFESESILQELETAKNNALIKAIVLRIDSPGGAVGPSQEIYEQVLRVKKDKPVIISMGTVAASGGYYIAVAGDRIIANGGSITGSIGVIIESFGLQNIAEKYQLESRVIKSGKYKDAGSVFRKMEEEEKKYFQDLSDNMYEQFLLAIATHRGLSLEKVRELAQGKIYTGQQAQKVKLVDEIGNLYHAIDVAKKMANLTPEAEVFWPQDEETFFSAFLSPDKDANSFLRLLKMTSVRGSLPLWIL